MKNAGISCGVAVLFLLASIASAEDGLVAYYSFDEGAGEVARDGSGNGNDGKLMPFGGDMQAGPAWVKARDGAALRFDGKNDHVVCGNSPSLQVRDALTITAWLNTAGVGKFQYVVSKCSFDLWLHPNGESADVCDLALTTRSPNNDGLVIYAYKTVPVGKWVFVAAVCNSAPQGRKLFVNGELVRSDGIAGPQGLIAKENLTLGRYIDQNQWYFSGLLDEVRVYNRPLSDAEIKERYAVEAKKIDLTLRAEAEAEKPVPLTLAGYIGLERKPSSLPLLPAPAQLSLKNDALLCEFSPQSGALAKLVSTAKGCPLVDQNEDIYVLDGARISEKEDRVTGYRTGVPGAGTGLEVVCVNPQMAGVEVTKQYVLDSGLLTKTVFFRGTSGENYGKLIFLRSRLHMGEEFYRNGLFYRPIWSSGGALGTGAVPFVAESSVKEPKNYKDSYGCCSIYLQPALRLGLAQYKFKVNGYYEGLRAEAAQRDLIPDVGLFNPGGWEMYMTGDIVRQGDFLSVESHFMVFDGDAREFHRRHLSLPGYAELTKPGAPLPDWFYKVKYFTGGGWGSLINDKNHHALERAVQVGKTLAPDEYMVGIISSWCIPGDYPTSGKIFGLDVDKWNYTRETTAEQVKTDVASCKAAIPGSQKMALYTWQASVGDKSQTYMKERLDWLLRGEGGALMAGGSGDGANYLKRIATWEQINWIADQYRVLFDYYGQDYAYIDGGGGGEMISFYPEKVFTHGYHGMLLGRAMKRAAEEKHGFLLQNVSVHPETSHCGFLETRSDQPLHDKRDWRILANCYWLSKQYQPDGWTIPLNWADQNCSNRAIMYGFPLEMNTPWYSFDLAYMFHCGDETMEVNRSKLVEGDRVHPNWWAFETETLESAFLQQGAAYLLPLISHADREKTERITVTTAGLVLDPQRPVYLWHFQPLLPWGLDWLAAPSAARPTVARTLEVVEVKGGKLEFEARVRPSWLEMIALTQVPAVVYSVNGRRNDFLLPASRGVSIEGTSGAKEVRLRVTSDASSAEVLALLPESWKSAAVSVAGAAAAFKPLALGKQRFALVSAPKGESELIVSEAAAPMPEPAPLVSPTVNSYFYDALGFYHNEGNASIEAVNKEGTDCWAISGPGSLSNHFAVTLQGTDGAAFRLRRGTARGEFRLIAGSFAKKTALDFDGWKEFSIPSEAFEQQPAGARFDEQRNFGFSVPEGTVFIADFRFLPLPEEKKVKVAKKRPRTAVSAAKAPPALDGGLDDDCWQGAAPLTFGDGKTTFRFAYDRENLYIAAKCDEAINNAPPRLARDDDTICKESRIEMYLVPKGSGKCYQLVTDPAKDRWDGVYPLDAPIGDKDWNPDWKIESAIGWGAYWTAEMAIPFKDMGVAPPKEGDVWPAGFFRQSVTGVTGWIYTGGRFFQPDENFGELEFLAK